MLKSKWALCIAAFAGAMLAGVALAADSPSNYEKYLQTVKEARETSDAVKTAVMARETSKNDLLRELLSGLDSRDKALVAVVITLSDKMNSGGPASALLTPPPQILAPPEDCGFFCMIGTGFKFVLGTAERLAPAAVGIVQSRYSHLTQVASLDAGVRTAGIQWGTVAGMHSDTVNGNTAVAGILGKPNVTTNTWNVGGDYAGGNLVGRYSGVGSGNSGNQLLGGGNQVVGSSNRLTSPGPYIQPTCTAGDTSGETSGGGSVNCPVQ